MSDNRHGIKSQAISDDPCPVRPLGECNGTYFFLTPSGKLAALKAEELTKEGILELFEGDERWLRRNFPTGGG